MIKMVTQFIKKHHLLEYGSTVLVGVSGGPDSMALLHFYLSIREEWNLTLIVLSADHQLRGLESLEDLQYVEEVCAKWEIRFIKTSLDVESYKKMNQVGTQVAAREVRYQFFKQQMEQQGADYLALGHHGDDQVETMLMGFVRSANPTALSGIPVKRKFATGWIVRPFLCVTKESIFDYCKRNEITPRIDPSNLDSNYTRNYFRKTLIPLINKENSNINKTVQRLSESLQQDEYFLKNEAQKMVHEVVGFGKDNKSASFKKEVFKLYPLALQRRAYHLVLNYLYQNLPKNLSYVQEEIFFLLLAEDKVNVRLDFPQLLKIEKSYENINFYFLDQNLYSPKFDERLHVPGNINISNNATITATYTDDLHSDDKHTYYCPTEKVTLPLHIRTRKQGDRMSWEGLNGSKKIKDIFIDEKIPRMERDSWPIVTDDHGNILWLIGLKKDNRHLQSKYKDQYIQLNYSIMK